MLQNIYSKSQFIIEFIPVTVGIFFYREHFIIQPYSGVKRWGNVFVGNVLNTKNRLFEDKQLQKQFVSVVSPELWKVRVNIRNHSRWSFSENMRWCVWSSGNAAVFIGYSLPELLFDVLLQKTLDLAFVFSLYYSAVTRGKKHRQWCEQKLVSIYIWIFLRISRICSKKCENRCELD